MVRRPAFAGALLVLGVSLLAMSAPPLSSPDRPAPAPGPAKAAIPQPVLAAAGPRAATPGERPAQLARYGRLPLRFEANRGQADRRARFVSRGPGYSLFLTRREAVLRLARAEARAKHGTARGAVVRMRLVGARCSGPAGVQRLPGVSHYLLGSDRARWRTHVPGYARVRYEAVYPGVNLVYYGNQQELEYDFEVAPRRNPEKIVLEFKGAGRVAVAPDGDLLLRTSAGTLRQRKPVVYQERGGNRQLVDGSYEMRGPGRVGFRVGEYDADRPLVIDPVLSYATYLGGVFADRGFGIAVDDAGSAYVTGFTQSLDFPAGTGAYHGGSDVFVTKLNAGGSAAVYSTYLGGGFNDSGAAIAVDGVGQVTVAGKTSSLDFPVSAGAAQSAKGESDDAFVARLDASGASLLYATFLGGAGIDQANGVAIDGAGNAYVAGTTNSAALPGAAPFPGAVSGAGDAFVAKLAPAGNAFLYTRLLSGSSSDQGNGIAVDSEGRATVCGATRSANFVTVNPLMTDPGDFIFDAFVARVSADGNSLDYSSYLGGMGSDLANAVALDADGRAHVTGSTFSTDFPVTAGCLQPALLGQDDAFVTRLAPDGSGVEYSTYLGTPGGERGFGIAVDRLGRATVAGEMGSSVDAFVTRLDAAGASALFAVPLAGPGSDTARAIALDRGGCVYVTGSTSSLDFATSGAAQPANGGGFDAFVVKIGDASADLAVSGAVAPNPVLSGSSLTWTVTVTNRGPGQATEVMVRTATPAGTRFASLDVSQGSTSSPAAGETGAVLCAIGNLDSGASATLRLTVTADCSLTNGTVLDFSASATGAVPDPDAANNRASATAVVSNPAPEIGAVTVSQTQLWPPNGKLVDLTVSYAVSDNCDTGESLRRSLTVFSSEPVTGGLDTTSPDWEIVDATHLRLRAERVEGGPGRTYTITVTATDSAGQSASRSVFVVVPKNGKK